MDISYFSIPIYTDKTDDIQREINNSEARVFIFLKKEDWNEANEILLKKIMSAVKINVETESQVLLLKAHENAFLTEELDLSVNNYYFAFGLNAKRLGLQSKTLPYQWMHFNKLHVLYSHTLTDLQKNVDYKKKLWTVLKEMKINE